MTLYGFSHDSHMPIVIQTRGDLPMLPIDLVSPDAIHEYGPALINSKGPVSHVKLSIYPDGGISRFRVFGRLA